MSTIQVISSYPSLTYYERTPRGPIKYKCASFIGFEGTTSDLFRRVVREDGAFQIIKANVEYPIPL